MRHHDGDAAITAGQAGNAARRAVGVGWVALGNLAMVIHITQGHTTGQIGFQQGFLALELGMTFTMGDGDRQTRAGHALEEDRGRFLDLHHGHPRLELLGAVTHEVRPELGTGDQFVQVAHHLAAVAHTQGKTVLALEEGLEAITGAAVEQNRLGPTLASAEHVTVGEAATGHQSLELLQADAAAEDIAHMHVDGSEAGTVEGRSHFHLTIDALLAQDGDLWTDALADIGGADVLVDVERELDVQARVVFLQQRLELLIGAVGVITQTLDAVAGFAPLALQLAALAAKYRQTIEADADVITVNRLTNHRHAITQASRTELRQHFRGGVLMHLNHRTQLFVEQHGCDIGGVVGQGIEEQIETAVTGKGHFQRRDQQTAVGTVVVGEDMTIGIQALDHREEGLEVFGVIHIRRLLAELGVDLGEDRGAETVLSAAKVDQDQVGFALVHAQLRSQGLANIADRSKAGHHQRQRRGDALVNALLLPAGLHRHGVLAHRNGDAQLRAQLHANCFYRIIQACIFARVAGGGHPVGGQLDIAQLVDFRRGQVGDGLANGHAPGGRGIQQGQRRALTHGHGFTGVDVETGGSHGAVSHRHLPGADHLITSHQASDAAVANGDQKAFAGHGRVMQHAGHGLVDGQAAGIEIIAQFRFTTGRTMHARRLAQQHVERHVHRLVAEMAVGHGQVRLGNGLADHGKGAALALADSLETLEISGIHGQHIALLGLVAPDFQRRHARLIVGHVAQFEATAPATVVDQLRQGIGDAAGTHVMDKLDRVGIAQLPAAVDHLLAAALHFRVLALHRGKIQIRRTGTSGHGRGRATAQADQHGRAAEHDQLGADADFTLLHMVGADVAHTAGQHDRLVIAAHFLAMGRLNRLLEGTEIAGQGRTTEFIVERGAAQGAFDHDVKGGDDALGLAVGHFPGLLETGDLQVGHGKAGQAGLGLGTATSGALIADLAAGAGGSARERGDGGRVVVGFHLHQDMHRLLGRAVLARLWIGEETPGAVPDDNRGIVLIGTEYTFAVHLVGVLDHAEQGFFLGLAIDIPAGVEDLVSAVLGVGLGKHHQFDVVGVTPQILETLDQVIDLVLGQGQAQLGIGLLQGGATTTQYVHRIQRLGLGMAEQGTGGFEVVQHQLGHAVVQQSSNLLGIAGVQLTADVIGQPPLDALDLVQAAVARDIAGLARPGRDGAEARDGEKQAAAGLLHRHTGAVLQQTGQHLLFVGGQGRADIGKMRKLGVQPGNGRYLAGQLLKQFTVAKSRKGGSAAQDQHRGQPLGRGVL